MTKKQLIIPAEEVKKHNELIQNRVNLPSVIGQRILATLIANIDPNQNISALTCRVEVKHILKNTSGTDYKKLKDAISEAAKATIELEFLGENPEDPEDNELYFYPFFSKLIYRNGYINAKFNPELKDILIIAFEKGNFTKYNLLEFYMLGSIYSQRLYEILKSYSFHKDKEKKILITELHELLNTPESLKKNFKDFRTRVLVPAHKEINKKTSFFYDWEPIKKGEGKTSPIIGVKFIFSEKKALPVVKKREDHAKEKESQKINQLALEAIDCANTKNQICLEQNNKKAVCEVCKRIGSVTYQTSLV